MKPDWDKLETELKDSDLVTIADVDCTAAGEPLCSKVGVQGYPTIKYWLAGDSSAKGKDYQGGRSYDDLKKFITKTFKPACVPSSGDGCSEDQKALIAELKDKDTAAELDTLSTQLTAAKADRKSAEDEFKQKRKGMKAIEKDLSKKVSVLKLLQKEAGKKDEL